MRKICGLVLIGFLLGGSKALGDTRDYIYCQDPNNNPPNFASVDFKKNSVEVGLGESSFAGPIKFITDETGQSWGVWRAKQQGPGKHRGTEWGFLSVNKERTWYFLAWGAPNGTETHSGPCTNNPADKK